MAEHKPLYIATIVGTLFMFLVVVAINALASGWGAELGIMEGTTGNISDEYNLEITPAGWTFSIWGVIYAWQAVFLLYGLTTLCRTSGEGYLYYDPGHMPLSVYIIYIINMICNGAWIFLFDREIMEGALAALALITFTLYVAIFVSARAVNANAKALASRGKRCDVPMTWIFVHNGFGIYAAWCSIATLLNMGIVMVMYEVEMELACTICLGVLGFDLLLWTVLDNTALHAHTRYLFTPYAVVIVALAGSMSKNWDSTKLNSLITVVLLGVACGCAVIKVIAVIVRSFTRPVYQVLGVSGTDVEDEKEDLKNKA